jgi:hypothetical protein
LLLLQKYAEKLTASQTSRGGWCHGFEDVKNSLNYDDLMATTVMAMQGLGMARREGIVVPQKVIDLGITYIDTSSDLSRGHIGYSPRSGQKGMDGAGRAGGGLLALSACGLGESPLAKAAKLYLQKSYPNYELNTGHASAQLTQSWAAWWAAQANEYPAFWDGQGAVILKRQKPDGTFNCAPSDGKEGDAKGQGGDMANAMHALMLVAGEGHLVVEKTSSCPHAAIPIAVDLAAKWGENVPEPLSKFAALNSSEQPMFAKDVAKNLTASIKALAKIKEPRIASTISTLLGPKPTYSAHYDEKARSIRMKIVLPAVRVENIAKAGISIAHDEKLMRSKASKKSITLSDEAKDAEIVININPEALADQKITAEVEWDLSGLKFTETISVPILRSAAP